MATRNALHDSAVVEGITRIESGETDRRMVGPACAPGGVLLRLPVTLTPEALYAVCRAVLAANGVSEAALRLTVTRGLGPRGLPPPAHPMPTVLITAGRAIAAHHRLDQARSLYAPQR